MINIFRKNKILNIFNVTEVKILLCFAWNIKKSFKEKKFILKKKKKNTIELLYVQVLSRSFFVSSIATTALVISTDNASKKYQDSKYGSLDPIKPAEKINWQSALLIWCSENKWKIIAGSWALSMIGSFSFLWRDKYLTKAQKLVQARMYAQGITLLVLLVSAGLSIDRSQFFDFNKNNTNNNNKEINDVHTSKTE
ncbi:unnamed protein product [Pneumocystis jirovecii]|uniref:HIG1 domain-containing protein n=1 Tax=Pneumocystis jirovecii TaxID=42068 RepID=L0P7F0_PNEJI|nr:unnamed protein product [Pneumocystis jirovecii]